MKKQYLSDGITSIEFIGLPSSGKTRFSERLLKELNDQKGKNGFFSFKDMVANSVGVIVGAIIINQ